MIWEIRATISLACSTGSASNATSAGTAAGAAPWVGEPWAMGSAAVR